MTPIAIAQIIPWYVWNDILTKVENIRAYHLFSSFTEVISPRKKNSS